MVHFRKAAAIFLGVWMARLAFAVAPEVRDGAHLFSNDAMRQANEQIRDIMRKHGRDLLIETFASAPPTPGADKLRAMSVEERNKFFERWATERAGNAMVNGVYVLVCKDPQHVTVDITPKAQPLIDSRARQQLQEILLNNFREKRFDIGLIAGVRFVHEKFGAAPIPQGSHD
jgi:uncharacterized membrane protein YgcG